MKCEITFLPDGRTISVRPGTSVLDAARKARVLVRTRCGGKMGCLMCKVTQVSEGGLSPLGAEESRKLAGLADEGMRLSCQAKIIGPATVKVPEDPLRSAVRSLLEKQRKEEEEGLW